MDDVLAKRAHVMMAGVANFAIENYVMHAAMSTVNAKMAHAFV